MVVAGGGAAGFFGAIAAAESDPAARVLLLEKSPEWLAKVTLSGGGRCNVTHHCFEVDRLVANYPRGGRELIGPFHRFQPRDTVRWFEQRGVRLKTEPDGRMFPASDRSITIVTCLREAAKRAGVEQRLVCGLTSLAPRAGGGLDLALTTGERLACDALLLATGGNRNTAGYELAASVGHAIEPPVPSLFTFNVEDARLTGLSGVSVEDVELTVPAHGLRQRGPLLVTHWGLSGPAVLKLSAWGARALASCGYAFELVVDWLPGLPRAVVLDKLRAMRAEHALRRVGKHGMFQLSLRLWGALVRHAGVPEDTLWGQVSNAALERLAGELQQGRFEVTGKSTNKDEFVTCGGVSLREVEFKTMESRRCPGLHFAGEVLDIDAVTGGFNFQAAWTTGWIAGHAMAGG